MKKPLLILATVLCLNTNAQCHVTQTGYTPVSCAGSCNAVLTFSVPSSCYSNPVYAVWSSGGSPCTTIPTATITAGSTYTVGGICGCGTSYEVLFTNSPITQDSSYMLTGPNMLAGTQIVISDPNPPQIQNITQTSHTLCLGATDTIVMHIQVGTGVAPISSKWTSSLGAIINHTNISNISGHNKDTLKATPTTTTHYTVFITDANGCVSTPDTLSVIVENCSAGIKQVLNNNTNINIYPNPSNGSFVIEPQNTLYNVYCTIYDVNGKVVLSQIINGKTIIDASSLNEGMYNINLLSNEGIVNKRVVIVK